MICIKYKYDYCQFVLIIGILEYLQILTAKFKKAPFVSQNNNLIRCRCILNKEKDYTANANQSANIIEQRNFLFKQ